MSEATIVSVVPRVIEEKLPGVNPGRYTIPAAKEDDIETLVIHDGYFMKYMLDDNYDRITTSAEEIAKDIVRMYSTSQVSYSPDAGPGIFYLNGAIPKSIVLSKHKDKIDEARTRQQKWFMALVIDADDFWGKFRQHKGISDLQRDACRYLGLKREWLISIPDSNAPKCPACYADLVHTLQPICGNCRSIINPAEYKKLGLEMVGAAK